MKRTPRQFGLASAALLLVLAPLLFASSTVATERPFKGRIEGTFVASPTPENPAIYVGGAQATGKATHVGAFRKVTSDVTDILTGEVEGVFTMTAPNGDLLTGTYSGVLFFGTTPGSFSWVLEAAITGGTGRFSAATGEFVFIADGLAVIVDGVVYGAYTETFDGTISY